MMKLKISFRLSSEDLDPAEITHALGIEPTHSHKKGDPNIGKGGRTFGVFQSGVWSFQFPFDPSASLSAHIDLLCNLVEPAKNRISTLRDQGIVADIFVGIFAKEGNVMLSIAPETSARLGEMNIELNLDFYCTA